MDAGFKWHKYDGSYFWYGNDLGGVGYVQKFGEAWIAYHRGGTKTFRWKAVDPNIRELPGVSELYFSEKEAFKAAKEFVNELFKPIKYFMRPGHAP